MLLSRLVKDLQWRRQLKDSSKDYASTIQIRSGFTFIISMVIFVVALFRVDEHLIYLAMASGFIGASFSVLINLKKRLNKSNYEELKVTFRWGYIATRGFIGLGAALIIFYFLKAEMLQGPVFPDVAKAELFHHKQTPADSTALRQVVTAVQNDTTTQPDSVGGGDAATNPPADGGDSGNEDHADDAANSPADGDDSGNEDHADDAADKERALLIIWCFLAGFSESLVPTLLKKTEEKATS